MGELGDGGTLPWKPLREAFSCLIEVHVAAAALAPIVFGPIFFILLPSATTLILFICPDTGRQLLTVDMLTQWHGKRCPKSPNYTVTGSAST